MKLLIVEDSALVLAQLLRIISERSGVEVVGSAADEESAVRVVQRMRPDAVLLDLILSPGSGLRVLERIRKAGSEARVLVLTNHTGDELRLACEAWGIAGFYDKSHELATCLEHLFGAAPELGRAGQSC